VTLIIIVVCIAFVFDFFNGFHDAANSIATVVSTRVLTPLQAVIWAAFFNFVAVFGFGTAVAKTVGAGMVDINVVTTYVVLSALIGAIIWDLITWWLGLPTSSSHALVGAFAGAAVCKAGSFGVIIMSGWTLTLIFIVLAPLIGMLLGFFIYLLLTWLSRKKSPMAVDRWFRHGQLVSAAAYSLGHGTNDAQKTMGIVAGLLFANHLIPKFEIPTYVIFGAYISMGLGTLSGGWRIVRTMGMGITQLKPIGGFAAELASATSLFTASAFGVPVSTTHTITGAIVGVGSLRRLSAVRWGVATRIIWAWLLTIPASAGIAALCFYALRALGYAQ
jgi:PiT family inorganic phosphate transporter